MSNLSVGKLGEKIAAEFLKKEGYKILEKNFQTRFGEIDLVAEDGDTLVFVEVKTRHTDKFGKPEESVTPVKIRKIIKAGQFFRNIGRNLPDLERIDVVAIELESNGKIKRLELIKNVTG